MSKDRESLSPQPSSLRFRARACGPEGACPGERAGDAAARKGVLGFGGGEFALRVICEQDHGCCQGGKTCYFPLGNIAGLPLS
jgi:hypothetical protein